MFFCLQSSVGEIKNAFHLNRDGHSKERWFRDELKCNWNGAFLTQEFSGPFTGVETSPSYWAGA